MISLSNLIKSSRVIPVGEHKQLERIHQYEAALQPVDFETQQAEQEPDAETISLRDQILNDAQFVAEERVKEATIESNRLLEEAEQQIDVWWLQKREEDQVIAEAARQEGLERGYAEGREQVKHELSQQWEGKLQEAAQLLQSAYEMKEQIIQEAEPFLVELSCSIAEKIIGKQLADTNDLALELIRKSLSRRREQGVITLCVSPSQLAFVQAAREELQLSIDSQAELQILPDSTITDHGCVIRSAFGSIDARIDTQLEEIKRELLQLANQSLEENRERDGYE
ncbi:FliH/SctL family protein [Paenibacillus sp. IITD108]